MQIVRYPAGGGELRDHVDPRKNQRVVSGLIMSKIGEDFKRAVFILNHQKIKKVNIEKIRYWRWCNFLWFGNTWC